MLKTVFFPEKQLASKEERGVCKEKERLNTTSGYCKLIHDGLIWLSCTSWFAFCDDFHQNIANTVNLFVMG